MAIERGGTKVVKAIPGVTMVSTHLRVNGIVFQQVGLRPNHTCRNEVDIVVRDSRLGPFALHEEFVLEIAEFREELVCWQEASFHELKRFLAEAVLISGTRNLFAAESSATAAAEVGGETRPDTDLDPFPRIPVEGDNSHLRRAEQAFTARGITFRLIGGQGSRA